METHGELIDYLKEHNGTLADNLFFGPEYFFDIRDKGLMVSNFTWVRVDRSPAPDLGYFVNSNFMLESRGGEYNMSCVGAARGVYEPAVVFDKRIWSIKGLKIS